MPDEIGHGKLLTPDMDQVEHDWVRGKIPKFTLRVTVKASRLMKHETATPHTALLVQVWCRRDPPLARM